MTNKPSTERVEEIRKWFRLWWPGNSSDTARYAKELLDLHAAQVERADKAELAFAIQPTTLENESFRESLRSELIIGLSEDLKAAESRVTALREALATMLSCTDTVSLCGACRNRAEAALQNTKGDGQ